VNFVSYAGSGLRDEELIACLEEPYRVCIIT